MRIPLRVLALLVPVILSAAFCLAQTPAKEPASVSGHVTIAGKSAAGVTVVATASSTFFDAKTVAKATTDDEGNYKLTGLAPGPLKIFPLSKAFIVKTTGDEYKRPEQSINVGEGEAATKVDFELVRGGVVTGRITDADGRPVIGERVAVVLEGHSGLGAQMAMLEGHRNLTDDRGIYRIYGLGPGNYKVSVGQAASDGGVTVMGMGGSQYVKTFYPGVQEEAKAALIEVKEGSEAKSIDIMVNKPGSGFAVAGRVIDADSGQPVPNLYIGHSSVDEEGHVMSGMNFTGSQSDANGKFRMEGLRPGRYAVYTFAVQTDNTSYSEPVPFEITNGDVTGIEVKIRRGASLSGVAALENSADAAPGVLQTLSLYAYSERKGGAPSFSRGGIAADGSFQFGGLAPGKVRIGVTGFPSPPKGLTLERTELDGVEQKEGIEVTAGQKLSGVRLVFSYGTGSVRGEVKVEGELAPVLVQVVIRSATGDPRGFTRTTSLDERYHFVVENIPPGSYELVVQIRKGLRDDESVGPVELLKQVVTVTNGAEVKVNLTVKLPEEEGDPE
jgi:protocatechuate 3,4-dioxygenase beta subunit